VKSQIAEPAQKEKENKTKKSAFDINSHPTRQTKNQKKKE